MNSALARSYRYCEEVTRREAGNFYPAFLLLPTPQRRSMCALYTFMRIADDLSDEPTPIPIKRQQLADWRAGLRSALAGKFQHESHPALYDTVTKYRIPARYLEAVIDGVEMDLEPVAYRTFADLRNYCWHVASVVGLSCIHIWGFHGLDAIRFAEDAGLAFQLTNILRDLGEDAARGRVYLPQEDLDRFGYTVERLRQGVCDASFEQIARYELTQALDDFGDALGKPANAFDRVSTYGSGTVRLGEQRTLTATAIPYRRRTASRHFTWYERVQEPNRS